MDAEALGVSYSKSIANGSGVVGAVKMYSDLRCEVSGKVVLANRNMGSTAVLREVDKTRPIALLSVVFSPALP